MRVFVVLLAVAAAASAASIATNYLPSVADNSLPSQEYISPETSEEPASLADDGYHYKIVRKLKLRLRRDVNELPSSEYLPTLVENQEELAVEQPISEEIVALKEAPVEKTELAEDGYELPANEYLPPFEVAEEVAVVEPVSKESAIVNAAPEENTELAEDGYRYKTVRRLKYRHRRDVNELPANEYLPPTEIVEEVAVTEPATEEIAVVNAAPEENTELAEDGYRYKTVRRLKYRQRRDVNELPANEYLPPTEIAEEVAVTEPASEEIAVVNAAPEENTELAEDGYRYKTVRRLKYRQRRDVNELPATEYLPPTEVAKEVAVTEPVSEEVADTDAEPEEKPELAEDGYRYKTVRRLKYRHRRDVNELPANEYLPPTEIAEEVVVTEPASEEIAVVNAAPEENTELAEDGYRYKTVRRLKYRQRRDVNEMPANENLPLNEIAQEDVADSVIDVQAPEETAVIADDGYRYKTVRRLKYRRH